MVYMASITDSLFLFDVRYM